MVNQQTTLAALIRKSLLRDTTLKNMLTTYGEEPAIFYQKAPDDTDPEWSQENQYPRLEFVIDIRQEPEHNRSGTMTVDIICSQTGTEPERIQPVVQNILAGAIFTPTGHSPTILRWKEAETFEQQQAPAALLFGITVLFELIDLPDMTTTEPDPVATFYQYVRAWDQAIVTIGGRTITPECFKPEREAPAVWARNLGTNVDRITNTVVWLKSTVVVHLFAPGLETRTTWLQQLAWSLAADAEMIAEDGAPMFIQNIQGDAAADEFDGQLKIVVMFGILRMRDDIPRPIQKTGARMKERD